MILRSAFAVFVASVVCVPAAFAQDPAPADVQEIATKDGFEKMRVPADWKVTGPRTNRAGDVWDIALPGDLGAAALVLSPRGTARDEAIATAALSWGRKDATYAAKPIPIALNPVESVAGKELVAFGSVRVVKRRGFHIQLQVPKVSAEKLRAAFVTIVQSFDTLRHEAPDAPDDFKRVTRDGYLYLLEPSVAEAEIAPVHRLLTAVASSLAKRYGPLPKARTKPVVVVLVPELARAADMCERASQATSGVWADPLESVLYLVPLPKGDANTAGTVAEHCAFLLLSQYFGLYTESWLLFGEGLLAASEGCCGKSPPVVDEIFMSVMPKSLPELRDLASTEKREGDYGAASLVYVAFFRNAGKPYSDAFTAYVKELRAGTDPEVAGDKTILALNQGALRTAAEAYMAGLKAPKAK